MIPSGRTVSLSDSPVRASFARTRILRGGMLFFLALGIFADEGRGGGVGSRSDWLSFVAQHGATESQALAVLENPIDVLAPIAEAGIPLLHRVSVNDRIVPPPKSTFVSATRNRAPGGTIEIIEVNEGPGLQRHPFDPPDPKRVVVMFSRVAAGGLPTGSVYPAVAAPLAEPLFKNSIVSTEIDFITAEDPSAFRWLRYVGQGTREMPDKRNDTLLAKDTFLFEAGFGDDTRVNLWAHRSFGSVEEARKVASMLSGPVGKLPGLMRRRLSHIVIHKGDETAFGESEGRFFVLYSGNMRTRVRHHDLEETVFHESVHATLDSRYAKSEAWRAAQKADGEFITEYGAKNPSKEDLAESALFAHTLLKHPGRLPEKVEQWVRTHTPNRLRFLETLFAKAHTGEKAPAGKRDDR